MPIVTNDQHTTTSIGPITIFSLRSILAYVGFITTAVFLFLMLFAIFKLLNGYESATTNSLGTKLLHLTVATIFWFVMFWILAFIMTFIPFIVQMLIAAKIKTLNWPLCVAGGAINGIWLSFIFASVPNFGFNVQGDVQSYVWHQFVTALPLFMISGAVAGIVFRNILKGYKPLFDGPQGGSP